MTRFVGIVQCCKQNAPVLVGIFVLIPLICLQSLRGWTATLAGTGPWSGSQSQLCCEMLQEKKYVQKMTKHVWYNTFDMNIIKTTKWTIILMQYLIRYLNWWYMQHFTQLWKLFLDNVSWNIYINNILSHVVIQYMFLLLPFLASNSLLTILLRSRTSDPAGMENGTSSITYL